MNLGLEDARVVVTGSSRGIGRAAAEAFLAEGARVLLNGVSVDRLAVARERLEAAHPERVDAVACDVSTPEGVAALFGRVDDWLGGLDVLVNNAGIYRYGTRFVDATEEEWEEVFRSNLTSIRLCSLEAIERMAPQQSGVILNAASFAALVPSVGTAAYAAAKAAVLSLTRTMAAELAPSGIRVNAYIPGVIATDMTAGVRTAAEDPLLSQIGLRRFGEPEEVAAPIVFLASKRASYITGIALDVSGGKLVVQRPEAAW